MVNEAGAIFLVDKVMSIRIDAISDAPAELSRQALGQSLGLELSHIALEKVLAYQVVRFYPVMVY